MEQQLRDRMQRCTPRPAAGKREELAAMIELSTCDLTDPLTMVDLLPKHMIRHFDPLVRKYIGRCVHCVDEDKLAVGIGQIASYSNGTW